MRHRSAQAARRAVLTAVVATVPLALAAGCSGGPTPDAGPPSSTAQVGPHRSDPMTTDEVAHVSRAELAAGIANKTITVVDTLPAELHQQKHLPGAIDIPGFPYETAAATTDALAPKLLPDKNADLALYCINVPCRNSEFVGRRLTELGYTHVRKYAEGIQDWMQAGMPLESGGS